jgi:site-specific recombinase XerD
MEKKDYMVTAQNKYLVDLRAIISYAYADGIHNNDRALQYFAKKKIEEKDKAIEIYLTEAELQALYEMPSQCRAHIYHDH